MPCRRVLFVSLLSALWSLGCQPSLGSPDADGAHRLVFASDGQPAYAGQALMRVSCANGICHSPLAVNTPGADLRLGAPAGLDFDVRPACQQSATCADEVQRLKDNQRRTYRWRQAIYAQVDRGYMPPGGVGHTLVTQWESSFGYAFADGTPLPSITTAEGKRLLKTWLGAGSPVVERFAPAPAGVPPGSDCMDGEVGDCIYAGTPDTDGGMPPVVEPTWTSIYTLLIQPRCGTRCHAAGAPDLRASTGLDLSTQRVAYDQMVGVAASGSTCGGAGSHVMPGDSANSLLLNVMGTSPRCGVRMPQGGPYLSADQLAVVAQWIDAGAPDN